MCILFVCFFAPHDHDIVQIRLIFRAVPSRKFPSAPGTDLFLIYVWRFDIVPQLNPAVQASSTQKGLYPDPSAGMYVLKHSRQSDRTIIGDVVPLRRLRALLDLIPSPSCV